MQTESVLQTKNRSGPAKNRFSVALATTNVSPAKFFLGRQLHSRLDLIKPNIRDNVKKKQLQSFTEPKRPQFKEGEKVMVREHGRMLRSQRKPGHFHTRLPQEIRATGVNMLTKC